MIAEAAKLSRILCAGDCRAALRRHRVAAGIEHAVVLRQLHGCRAVVDIGANRGQFALAARHVFPAAQIDSFEPLSGPAQRFRTVFASDPRVVLHEAAIGPRAGKAEIHVSARDDSSSLLPIGKEQSRLFPGTAEAGTSEVHVGRLVEFLSADEILAPALLKLDVQGFELAALQGCEEILDRFKWVYAECSFVELYEEQALAGEVIAWLRARGLSLSGVYNVTYDRNGSAVQADFLFTRDGLIA